MRLCGVGKWLFEKHATKIRLPWRKLHTSTNTDTGWIVKDPGHAPGRSVSLCQEGPFDSPLPERAVLGVRNGRQS